MTEEKHSEATFIEKLENYAVDYGLLLAGWVVNGPTELTPFDREQITVVVIAAVGAYAKTLPEYDPEADITNVVQLALHTYAEATRANLVAIMEDIEKSSPEERMSPLDDLTMGQELETLRESYGELVTDVEYPDVVTGDKEHASAEGA